MKAKLFTRFYIALFLTAGGALAVVYLFFREEARAWVLDGVARRHVSWICLSLSEQQVTERELCALPIPEIAIFSERYQKIRSSDETWFAAHGWSYFPNVSCPATGVEFQFMSRQFHCDGPRGVLVKQ